MQPSERRQHSYPVQIDPTPKAPYELGRQNPTLLSTRPSEESSSVACRPGLPATRFVIGNSVFSYHALGSLRPGHEPVQLFSTRFIGLSMHVTLCGFAFYFFSYGYGRLLAEYLKANDERQVQAAHYVLVWPQCMSLIIGLVSDCFPIYGYRRKSYMLIGWVLSLVMYLVIIVMDTYADSGNALFQSSSKDAYDLVGNRHSQQVSRYPIPFLMVSLVAALGIQICWLTAVAAGIEYAQREHLYERGRLVATLVTLYYVGGTIAQALTASVISDGVNADHLVSTMSVGGAASVLAVASALGILMVMRGFAEEPFINTTRVGMSVRQRLKNFWRFCHQNVVYRAVFFITGHLFLLALFNSNVRDAVRLWSGVSNEKALVFDVVRMGVMAASVLVWRQWLVNYSWRMTTLLSSTMYLAAYVILTICTTLDLVRNEWFFLVMMSLGDIPRPLIVLFAMVLPTEISDVGHEGVTLALGMSLQTLSGLAGYTLAAIFPGLTGYKVSMEQVQQDAHSTRQHVLKAYLICLALNMLAYPLIALLPKQKLDAQQLRAFGGYNRYASTALIFTFAVLLVFNLSINIAVTM